MDFMKKDEEKLKSRTSKIIIRKQISLDFNLTSYVFLFLTLKYIISVVIAVKIVDIIGIILTIKLST